MRIIFIFLTSLILLVSCDDILVTNPSSAYSEDEVYGDYTRAQQPLNACYKGIPVTPFVELDYYTDNAVKNSEVMRSAVGGMTAENSPVSDQWNTSLEHIILIDDYLSNGFDVPVYDVYDSTYSADLMSRSRGEALGLRAYYQWQLLKYYAGKSSSGELLGFPIITETLSLDDVNKIPRATYKECMTQINADIDSALKLVRLRYDGNDKLDNEYNIGRVSGEMLWAMKARMHLFAASEAYQVIGWDSAVTVAYNALNNVNAETLNKYGDYNNTDNPDHFWRSRYNVNGTLEKNHLPPTLYGKGQCNPSQNLVDAFPDANGYPITNGSAFYSKSAPYDYRDSRLSQFIFHNGLNSDYRESTISTYEGGQDANGSILNIATRTGYFMKKFLSSQINLVPYGTQGKTSDFKVNVIYSKAGLYLDYAEAAIEAELAGVLPSSIRANSGYSYLKKIRNRGEVRSGDSDFYLIYDAQMDLNLQKEIVRNERRLEFAFEGERYFDVRRWMLPLTDLNIDIMGMSIRKEDTGDFLYSDTIVVEKHVFKEYMYYNPIPREEILKSSDLVQNAGW